MKRATFLLLPAIALLNSACEKHDASELAKIEESEAHHEGAVGHEGHGAQPAESGHEKAPGAASPSPAPQFFSR